MKQTTEQIDKLEKARKRVEDVGTGEELLRIERYSAEAELRAIVLQLNSQNLSGVLTEQELLEAQKLDQLEQDHFAELNQDIEKDRIKEVVSFGTG